jgi:hypothetical protein
LDKASSFFLEKDRLKGSLCFFGGIVFVLIKWPIIGLIVETFGFINLFGYAHCPAPCTSPHPQGSLRFAQARGSD